MDSPAHQPPVLSALGIASRKAPYKNTMAFSAIVCGDADTCAPGQYNQAPNPPLRGDALPAKPAGSLRRQPPVALGAARWPSHDT